MSLQDSLFVEEVEYDITLFSKDTRRKRVLVFPPVNNYRRFLIHQLVQERFENQLKTFSIGQGIARRTVVCYQSDISSNPKLNGVPSRTCVELTDSFPKDSACGAMGVEETRRLSQDSSSPEHTRMRQVKTSPAVQIYRPPAARRANKDNQSSSTVPIPNDSSCSSAKGNRQRRPDRAVYVPKHRRSTESDENGTAQANDEIINSSQCRSRCARARTTSPPLDDNHSFGKQFSPNDHDRNLSSVADAWEKCISLVRPSFTEYREKMDDGKIPGECIESPDDIEDTRESTSVKNHLSDDENSDERTFNRENQRETTDNTVQFFSSSSKVNDDIETKKSQTDEIVETLEFNGAKRNNDFELNRECCSSDEQQQQQQQRKSLDRDEQTNNKNLRTSSTRNVPNVLIISDTKVREEGKNIMSVGKENNAVTTVVSPPEKKPKKVARVKSKPASPPSPPIKLNRDECDWDSLFDDNGECLDPTLMEELTAAVGEVTIEQPKNDYKAFSRPVEVSSDEFAHVIEIYNFPSDFKTCDLAAVFSPWKNGGFELKWVDDTHCLGVFSSPLVAAEVLGSDHPFVKTRPLSSATALSKTKARKSVEFLQPYKSRPQTCAALARRLVTGALGVKLATARQEREEEKLLLREAKEKRRLANKQREDIWEGIISEK